MPSQPDLPNDHTDSSIEEQSGEAIWVDEDFEETIGDPCGYGMRDPQLEGFFAAGGHDSVFVVRELPASPQPSVSCASGTPGAGFTLLRCVGSGGMGEIWEATQASLRRRIAIKRLRTDITSDKTRANETRFLTRLFRQEALTTAHLQHPNIVPVHDLGVDEKGNPLLAMKLVRGLRWSKSILNDADLPSAEFYAKHLRVLIDVSNAVAFAHSKGIIHRDLKPSQVMIGEFGEVMLMDWGLAAPISPPHSPQSKEAYSPEELCFGTLGDSVSNPAGTPAYMAPEQTLPEGSKLGPRTDVFLLGGMLYYLLTKTAPYKEKDRQQAFKMAKAGVIEPPEVRAPGADIPPELSALALRAMAFDPSDRIPSALDLVKELNDYLSGAGKRRESAAIAKIIAERVAADPDNYAELAECQVALARAEGLWSDNPQIQEVGDQLAGRYARLALANNDLILAHTQADSIHDETKRQELLVLITAAQKRKARAARERNAAMAAVLFFLLLLIAGGIKYARAQNNARKAAETARHEAQLQRDAAETEEYYYGIGFAGAYLREGRADKALETMLHGVPAKLRNWEWGCLLAAYGADDMILCKGAPGKELYYASFSPDGQRIAVSQRGGKLSMWNAGTGARIFQRDVGSAGLWVAKFSPDGTKLLVASHDGKGFITDSRNGDVITTLTGVTADSPNMRGGAFSPDGRRVATTGSDATLRVWDPVTSAQLLAVSFPNATYDAAFSPDGSQIAVAMLGRGQVALCDSLTGKVLRMFEGHGKSVYTVRFSPDGKRLVTTSLDQKARVFDVATSTCLLQLAHSGTYPNCSGISPDGAYIVTGSENGECDIWDSTSGTLVASLQAGPEVHGVEFSPNGRKLVTTSVGGVKVWNLDSVFHSVVRVAKSDIPPTATIDYARNISFPYDRMSTWGTNDVAWLGGNGRTYLKTGQHWYGIDSFYSIFSPNGAQRIEIGYAVSTVSVYDNSSSTPLIELAPKSGFNACFSNNGKLAATGSQNGLLQVWDTSNWKEIANLQGSDKTALWCLQFSPDDSLLALGWLNGSVTMWDVKSRKPIYEIKAHLSNKPVVTVAFSADGKRFVTSSSEKTAKVWDTRTGHRISTMSGHEKFLVGAVFSPDGTNVLTASDDGKVKLWEARTGREIITIYSAPPDKSLLGASFSKDGRRIFATTSKGDLVEIETFPWADSDYPGSPDMPFDKRLELYKRRTRLGDNIQFADIGW